MIATLLALLLLQGEDVLLRILRAEDERRCDAEFLERLSDGEARVRRRAALAAGRIGNDRAIPALVELLQKDRDGAVRATAAFGLGEIGSAQAVKPLSDIAENGQEPAAVRARAVEALGKIGSEIPSKDEEQRRALGDGLLKILDAEHGRKPQPDRLIVLSGMVAVLRLRPTKGGAGVAAFLGSDDATVRAEAGNVLTRLRAKDGSDRLQGLLISDQDPVVRANAARALAATGDPAVDPLVERALGDQDGRVRVSAIRSLGSIRNPRAVDALLKRAGALLAAAHAAKGTAARPTELHELLEIASVLGRLKSGTSDEPIMAFLRDLRAFETAPEIETALARVAPSLYVRGAPFDSIAKDGVGEALAADWRRVAALVQGLGMIPDASGGRVPADLHREAEALLRLFLKSPRLGPAEPDLLRAFAAFRPKDLGPLLRSRLWEKDVIVRATAAELLGLLPPDDENAKVLAEALASTERDESNDAALAILAALGLQKAPIAREAITKTLSSKDHLIRRAAVAALKAVGGEDLSSLIGPLDTGNADADYRRALARAGRRVRAVVESDKGPFTIELLPDDAPLTVDNFVRLATRGFFDGVEFHRVVPNFVVQGGDPRGDGNGGPGRQIRCEINEIPFERGAVGMALSGKDTGGSQWFVTHSLQSHLNGGYTVFGRVIAGMDVVDRLVRRDRIRKVVVTEEPR